MSREEINKIIKEKEKYNEEESHYEEYANFTNELSIKIIKELIHKKHPKGCEIEGETKGVFDACEYINKKLFTGRYILKKGVEDTERKKRLKELEDNKEALYKIETKLRKQLTKEMNNPELKTKKARDMYEFINVLKDIKTPKIPKLKKIIVPILKLKDGYEQLILLKKLKAKTKEMYISEIFLELLITTKGYNNTIEKIGKYIL